MWAQAVENDTQRLVQMLVAKSAPRRVQVIRGQIQRTSVLLEFRGQFRRNFPIDWKFSPARAKPSFLAQMSNLLVSIDYWVNADPKVKFVALGVTKLATHGRAYKSKEKVPWS